MTDLSSLIPWLFVVVGIAASLYAGHMMRGPKGFSSVIAAGFLAGALGAVLTFATVLTHSACIDPLHLCVSRGDGNMSYWFHTIIALPLFWLLMLVFPFGGVPAIADTAPYDNAVVAALNQFRQLEAIHARCPSCGSLVSVEPVSPAGNPYSALVQTGCTCGKCSGKFQLQTDRV